MDEVVLDGEGGRLLRFGRGTARDRDGWWSAEVTLSWPNGSVFGDVPDLGNGLADFIEGVAADWAGFEGDRSYGTIEGHLELTCRHDGRGLVTCDVVLRDPSTEWDVRVETVFGAGSHLERIARDLAGFVRSA